MRIKPIFAWYDLWIGAFYDRAKRRLYVFPVPMFGFYIERRTPSPVPSSVVDIEAEIERVVQSVNEWDDRTSPDEYPEHLLITSEELTLILRNFAATLEGSTNG